MESYVRALPIDQGRGELRWVGKIDRPIGVHQ